MNKKQERIATIALAAFLVAMFCYQVAYGYNIPLKCHVTKEEGNVCETIVYGWQKANSTVTPTPPHLTINFTYEIIPSPGCVHPNPLCTYVPTFSSMTKQQDGITTVMLICTSDQRAN